MFNFKHPFDIQVFNDNMRRFGFHDLCCHFLNVALWGVVNMAFSFSHSLFEFYNVARFPVTDSLLIDLILTRNFSLQLFEVFL